MRQVCVFASFVRRVWGCESVGREEVENVHLCPEEPCVNVLHIVQGDDEIQGAIQRLRGFQFLPWVRVPELVGDC